MEQNDEKHTNYLSILEQYDSLYKKLFTDDFLTKQQRLRYLLDKEWELSNKIKPTVLVNKEYLIRSDKVRKYLEFKRDYKEELSKLYADSQEVYNIWNRKVKTLQDMCDKSNEMNNILNTVQSIYFDLR